MTAIGTTYADGVDERKAAHVNSLGLALKGLGIDDDNAGKLILPASFGFPFTLRSGDGSPQAKAVGASATYTVPAGKFYYVHTILPAGSTSITIDPSDAASWTLAIGASGTGMIHAGLCLGAGDAITTPGTTFLMGLLVDADALVGSPTRVIKELNNSTTYTVGAGKMLLVTHLQANTSSLVTLNLDGGNASSLTQHASSNHWVVPRLVLAAGQQLSAAGATNFTLSGLEFTV